MFLISSTLAPDSGPKGLSLLGEGLPHGPLATAAISLYYFFVLLYKNIAPFAK